MYHRIISEYNAIYHSILISYTMLYMFNVESLRHISDLYLTVGFHNFKSRNFKLSVSNPKRKYAAYVSGLSRISNCQSLGRKNKHEILKTDHSSTESLHDVADSYLHVELRKRRSACKERGAINLSLWGLKGDTPPIRNNTFLGPSGGTNLYIYIYIYMNIHICICIYIYIYIYTYWALQSPRGDKHLSIPKSYARLYYVSYTTLHNAILLVTSY